MTPCDPGSENPALDRMILVFVPDWSESCERKLCQRFSCCRKLTQIHLSAQLSGCVQRPREVGSSRAGWHSFCNGISFAAEPVACVMLCTDFVATQEDFLEVASADKWLGIGLAGPGITWFVVWPSHTVWPHRENAYCHPLGRRSLVGCSPWGCEESGTTERLHFHFSLSCFGEGNDNPLQCSCLENPRDGEAWWAAVYGVAQSRTRLQRLSSSSSSSKGLGHWLSAALYNMLLMPL